MMAGATVEQDASPTPAQQRRQSSYVSTSYHLPHRSCSTPQLAKNAADLDHDDPDPNYQQNVEHRDSYFSFNYFLKH